MSDVVSHPISWLWPGRIPRGKVTLLAGDPGLGKSFLTAEIAARVTRAGTPGIDGGDWPDGPAPEREPGEVIMLNAEDDAADTLRPRLETAGADLSRVRFVCGMATSSRKDAPLGHVALDRDVHAIMQAVESCKRPRLVVIDPISAYMGDADSNNNCDVRAVLSQLTGVAHATGVSMLCVTHLSKSGGGSGQGARAVYRAMGSLAFTAAARIVWHVAAMPDDQSTRVLTCVKCNIGPMPTGMTYRLEDGRVRWIDTNVSIAADDLDDRERVRESQGVPEAAEFLRATLAGGPLAASVVIRRAEEAGISLVTLKRAKPVAGVASRKGEQADGQWCWVLRDQQDQQSKGITSCLST
jgi:KaiC/GvpD/RAD55 family RecA-like ATPase